MPRKVRITAIQIPDEIQGSNAREKYECNLTQIEEYLTMAGEAGCDLTGVGECSNTRGLTPEEANEVRGPRACRRVGVMACCGAGCAPGTSGRLRKERAQVTTRCVILRLRPPDYGGQVAATLRQDPWRPWK